MEQIIFYLKLGFMHILDINAYDHFLFIVSITIPFSFRNFKIKKTAITEIPKNIAKREALFFTFF